VSLFVVCNQSASPDTFRVSRSVGGGVTATKDYLAYDTTVDGYAIVGFDSLKGMCLNATDVVRVYSTNGTLSFNMDGQEKT
jgi:hypothetical protein